VDAKKLLTLGGVAVGGWLLVKYLAKKKAPEQLGFFDGNQGDAARSRGEAEKLYAMFQDLVVGMPAVYEALDPETVKRFKDTVARYKAENLDGGAALLRRGDAIRAKYMYDSLILEAPRMIAWVQRYRQGAPEAIAAQRRQALQLTVRAQS